MKLPKFLLLTIFITLFSLLYVYQQTEIFRLAYVGQKKVKLFQDSLDKNTILRYNFNKNTSLVHIDNKMFEYANFEMPESYRMVKLLQPQSGLKVASQRRSLKRQNIVSLLFSVKRQAEAKTINTSTQPGLDGKSFDYALGWFAKDGELVEPRNLTIKP